MIRMFIGLKRLFYRKWRLFTGLRLREAVEPCTLRKSQRDVRLAPSGLNQ